MLIRASVPFWSKMHKWLRCRGTLFEKLVLVLRIIMRANWWLKRSIKNTLPLADSGLFLLVSGVMEAAAPKPKKTRIPDVLTHVDENILKTIYRYYYMTVAQVVKSLGYSVNSLPTVRTRLLHLEKKGFISSIYLPTVRRGNFPKIFYLASSGLDFLRKQGFDVVHRFHATEQKEKQYLFLKHTLAVNDVLIAAKRVTKQFPQISLYEFRHERELKRDPEKFTITLYHEADNDIDPAQLFLSPVWEFPFSGKKGEKKVALLAPEPL
jgi:hypothetical protein